MVTRRMLLLSTWLIVIGLFPWAASVCAQIERESPRMTAVIAGPMLGHTTESSVAIWMQCDADAEVALRWRALNSDAEWKTTVAQIAAAENAYCVQFELTDLPFGSQVEYQMVVNGVHVARSRTYVARTLPHWNFRTEPPEITVALGSCAFNNDAAVDRPGRPYGGDPKIFTAIAEQKPDLMLWLGDNTYYREPDWSHRRGMLRRWSYDRRLPELQPLLRNTANYAIWDDHDFGPDDSDWTFPNRRAALDVFKTFWCNPAYGLEETPGVFCRFVWGDVEFFLLDDRYHRSPNRAPTSDDKRMFGKAQLRWLIDSLDSSSARFKVVAGGNQFWNPLIPFEALGHFPVERDAFADALAERDIRGLFFLSGDRHHAELLRVEREDQYPLYEFTSSPLTSGLHPVKSERDNPARVPDTLVADRRNFGILRFSGKRLDRRVTLECRDEAGEPVWTHELKDSDLGWKR